MSCLLVPVCRKYEQLDCVEEVKVITRPIQHTHSAHGYFRLAEAERKSRCVSSGGPPQIRHSTGFSEWPKVQPDSWGWVPPMGCAVLTLHPRRCPIDTGPIPLPQNLSTVLATHYAWHGPLGGVCWCQRQVFHWKAQTPDPGWPSCAWLTIESL